MQVMKTQGSRTLELFRAITVLVFPTDTSKAKAMAKRCKPGRERGGESEAKALSALVPFGMPWQEQRLLSPALAGLSDRGELLLQELGLGHPQGHRGFKGNQNIPTNEACK